MSHTFHKIANLVQRDRLLFSYKRHAVLEIEVRFSIKLEPRRICLHYTYAGGHQITLSYIWNRSKRTAVDRYKYG